MPRKEETTAVENRIPDIDMELLKQDAQLVNQRNQELQTIDNTYSDQLPYDRTRLENEVRFYINQSTDAMLEAGKRLILLKEHEAHGDYLDSLKAVNIEPRTAQNIVKATLKFGDVKTKTLSHLGKSKLFALMSEPDEEIEQLLDGGTIAGKTLDDIDRMSVRELKQSLRNEKKKREEEAEATEKLLEQKDKKINRLDKKLMKAEQRSLLWDERAREIQIEVTTVGVDALQAIARLDELRDVILNEQYDEEPSELEMQAKACVYYDMVEQMVAGIGNLMHACDQVFGGYKEQAQPMVDYWGDSNDVKEI